MDFSRLIAPTGATGLNNFIGGKPRWLAWCRRLGTEARLALLYPIATFLLGLVLGPVAGHPFGSSLAESSGLLRLLGCVLVGAGVFSLWQSAFKSPPRR